MSRWTSDTLPPLEVAVIWCSVFGSIPSSKHFKRVKSLPLDVLVQLDCFRFMCLGRLLFLIFLIFVVQMIASCPHLTPRCSRWGADHVGHNGCAQRRSSSIRTTCLCFTVKKTKHKMMIHYIATSGRIPPRGIVSTSIANATLTFSWAASAVTELKTPVYSCWRPIWVGRPLPADWLTAAPIDEWRVTNSPRQWLFVTGPFHDTRNPFCSTLTLMMT